MDKESWSVMDKEKDQKDQKRKRSMMGGTGGLFTDLVYQITGGNGLSSSSTSTTSSTLSSPTTMPTNRRPSTLFSLQFPLSKRRFIRFSLISLVSTLMILLVFARTRNERDARLIRSVMLGKDKVGGGFGWPEWVGVDSAARLAVGTDPEVQGQGGDVGSTTFGRKLKRGLEDLGLMPVFLDANSDLRSVPRYHRDQDDDGLQKKRSKRLNPITTPPHVLSARAEEEEAEMHSAAVEADRRQKEEEAEDMPWFWGNVDEVGKSPFDHWPELGPGQKGKRVLFLTGESRCFLRSSQISKD